METVEARVAVRDFLLVRGRSRPTVGILEPGSKGWVAREKWLQSMGRGAELEEAEEAEEAEEGEEVEEGKKARAGELRDRKRQTL